MPTISTLTVDVETNTSKFSKGLKIAGAGLAALGAGAVFAFKQFEDSEKVAAQTDAVLKSTGHSANVTAEQIDKLTHGLMMKAAIDDEVIRTGTNMLLTFKNIRNEVGAGNDIFDQATKATLDMSVAMGTDMKSSAIQVGKALNDPVAGITALTRVGVTFTEQQKKQIEQMVKSGDVLGAQKLILAELTSEFQGSAKAQATSSAATSIAFGELAEKVGSVLAPAFKFLLDQLLAVADFLEANVGPAFRAAKEWILGVWEQVQPLAEGIANILVPAFQMAWNAVVDRLIPGLKKLWDAIGPVIKIVGVAALAFGVMIVAQLAIFITAISHVIDVLGKVVDFIGDKVVGPVVRFFQRLFQDVRDILKNIGESWRNVWEGVKDFFSGVWNGIVSIAKTSMNAIIGFINLIIGGLNELVNAIDVSLGPFINVPDIPDIPSLHGGGVITSSGIASVHKGETVVPGGIGGGGDLVLQIDGQTFARIARNELLRLKGSRVNLGLA